MTIETKYNIGDEVWVMSDNRPTMLKIIRIVVTCDGLKTEILYRTSFGKYLFEQECFPTKEELLKSL